MHTVIELECSYRGRLDFISSTGHHPFYKWESQSYMLANLLFSKDPSTFYVNIEGKVRGGGQRPAIYYEVLRGGGDLPNIT